MDIRTINSIRIKTMAILQRGTCCGTKCRQCPYGWINVDVNRHPRPALVPVADVQASQTLFRQLQEGDADALQRMLENNDPNLRKQ